MNVEEMDPAVRRGWLVERIGLRLDHLRRLAEDADSHVFASTVATAAEMIADAINIGGSKVLVCGNGGSAAQAQHFAAELVGRYRKERRALPAIALTTDTSALTAIANDYGYECVFERQVWALARAGDVLIVLSTSGRSQNVIEAVGAAGQCGAKTIAITGEGDRDGVGGMDIDVHIEIPSNDTALIQELTQHVLHTIAEIVEERCG